MQKWKFSLTHFSVKSENLGKRRHVPSPSVVFERTVVASLLLYGILQICSLDTGILEKVLVTVIWREESFH